MATVGYLLSFMFFAIGLAALCFALYWTIRLAVGAALAQHRQALRDEQRRPAVAAPVVPGQGVGPNVGPTPQP
ncbi:MAG: hypothetical protein ACTJHU_07485 [Mycetocola sp.]